MPKHATYRYDEKSEEIVETIVEEEPVEEEERKEPKEYTGLYL